MKMHTLNMFRISNLHELDFSYRLLSIDLPNLDGKEELLNKNLRKITEAITSKVSAPAVIVKRNNAIFIAVPASVRIQEMKVDVTPFVVTVKPVSQIYSLTGKEAIAANNFALVQQFIDFEIRRQLGSMPDLWKLNGNQFFLKEPSNRIEASNTDIYTGFSYKIQREKNELCICCNLATKYADMNYLNKYVSTKNVQDRIGHLLGRRALYQNGDNWYAIEIKGFGNEISKHEFEYQGNTFNVYDLVREKTANHRFKTDKLLKPSDVSLLYSYPGRSMEPHNGAASLAKILFSPHDPQVKSLHGHSIKDPSRRFQGIAKYINTYFQKLKFGGKELKISKTPLEEQLRSFSMPGLKFNNGKLLLVGNAAKGGNTQFSEFGAERKRYIIENGIISKRNFDTQYLLVPDYMEKGLVEAFKRNAEYQLKKLAPAFGSFIVIRYKTKPNASALLQVKEIETALQQNNATSGFALFLLPDESTISKKVITNFHDCLKTRFYPGLKVQCASSSKISSYFQSELDTEKTGFSQFKVPVQLQGKFSSYLFNLAMEHLIVNRKWAFALANNLRYDIYIGIDVHNRYAGLTFFFKNGEQQLFIPVAVAKKASGQRAEKLKAKFLFENIYPTLKSELQKHAPNPNGFVIVRDGRSFGEEQKALEMLIDQLSRDGLVNASTIKSGVVDIHKQSALPFRIAVRTNYYNQLMNPACGTYKIFGNKEGFIFNTGHPFGIRGTAKPLQLVNASGNLDFLKVMEDIFCQSMLAYSAPDKGSSLPSTLKLIDTLLEPLSATGEIIEDDEEEVLESSYQ